MTGGTPPVTSTCTANSGAIFSAGKTAVTCTTTDAISRQAVCTFDVTVVTPDPLPPPTPRLIATRFEAFGDSMTAGENGCGDGEESCTPFIDNGLTYPELPQITPINNAIRALAVEQNVVLVDAYQTIAANTSLYLADDKLHLTRDGRTALAQSFLTAIAAHFEVAQASLARAPRFPPGAKRR